MAVTQDDIDNITRAIASGERQVSLGGKQVTYRSIDDLIKARDTLIGLMANGDTVQTGRQFGAYYAGRGVD